MQNLLLIIISILITISLSSCKSNKEKLSILEDENLRDANDRCV